MKCLNKTEQEHTRNMCTSMLLLEHTVFINAVDVINGITSTKKKLKFTQQKSRRLEKKVESLENVVKELKNKGLVSDNCT